jgi:hypothetical protein
VAEAEARGYAVREGNPLVLTDAGRGLASRLVEARRSVLAGLLGDWDPDHDSELGALVAKLSRELCGGDSDHPDRPERPGRDRPSSGDPSAEDPTAA